MQFSYRGVSYDYNPPTVGTSTGKVGGKYRGLDWRFRNLNKPPVLQPRVDLKYRGVSYQIGGHSTTTKDEQTKTPTLSVQDKARSLMRDRLHAFHKRQLSMLNRSAAEVGLVPCHQEVV
ncbi:MAG: DUF4278 domain-containing protein [Symploca sp. SIO3C6]|uniref:DUF4278 domain-containing protein n=1 Tax=Symploca sp. SIO1C4 TaxID=2607765 RepID=A0A6B3NKR3_9CYAN|nr:DUF4278 domain-containing protein [Symploca sp. SIO3C6]NER31032.1 DUF4278 domain-containing protein [Symploca sp. SIO1C4]NET08300.1 DUF4278 domain-containing protein [Symploca sp. SIO2B6]NET54457.1 DUF4278 domain-containing protein [Merismopedia sp. SIO2A8]